MITRRSSPLPSAVVVALGGVLLAAALNAGAAARATPLLPTPAVILTVGDRSKPSELIHLLRDLASYDPLTAARYVAEADAAYRRGSVPVVRIPMPSAEAATAVAQAAPQSWSNRDRRADCSRTLIAGMRCHSRWINWYSVPGCLSLAGLAG